MKKDYHYRTDNPEYDAWMFGAKEKLSPSLRGLRERFDALSPIEKIRYVQQVRRMDEVSKESREIIGHADKIDTFTNGPATVKVYHKGDKTLVSGECPECKQFPCKHTGANFTKNGLVSGIFPKDTSEEA
jgi:hypothetical protein